MLSIFSVLSVQSDTNCPVPQLTIFTHASICAPAKPLCEAN